MADARGEAEWDRASAVMATLYNVNASGKGAKAVELDHFNPFGRRRREVAKRNQKRIVVGIDALKMFLDPKLAK